MVTRYTGMGFEEGTSVGIGHVLELYANFGAEGVMWGLALLGMVITCVDRMAGRHLARADWGGFTLWYLPGLSLLQAGGSFAELISTAGASLVVALLANRFIATTRLSVPSHTTHVSDAQLEGSSRA